MHGAGEAAFIILDKKQGGTITRADLVDATLSIRDAVPPQLKPLVNGKVVTSIESLIPEGGLTKGQMTREILEIDTAMVKADKDGNGFLSPEEIAASPELTKLSQTLKKDAQALGSALTDTMKDSLKSLEEHKGQPMAPAQHPQQSQGTGFVVSF